LTRRHAQGNKPFASPVFAIFTRIPLHQSSIHPTHSFEHHAPRCMGRSMRPEIRPHACVLVEVEGGHGLEGTSRSNSFPIGKVLCRWRRCLLLCGTFARIHSLSSHPAVVTYTWSRNTISKQHSHPPHSCILDLPRNLHLPPLPGNPNPPRLLLLLLRLPPQRPPHSTTTSPLRTRRA
jgi:hypothetical protein